MRKTDRITVNPVKPSPERFHRGPLGRVLERYPTGVTPAFVESRMRAWDHLQQLAEDRDWRADADVLTRTNTLRDYINNPDDVLPDHLPSIGLLDDALLVDVALQNLRGELADYESFCHFRQVAADFAGIDAGLAGNAGLQQFLAAAFEGAVQLGDQGQRIMRQNGFVTGLDRAGDLHASRQVQAHGISR